jgi:hypothetical protein
VRCRAGAPAEPAVLAFQANRLEQALKAPSWDGRVLVHADAVWATAQTACG